MERQRPFQGEGFTDAEADAVVRRAVELQQQAAPGARISGQALEESAEVAGVAPQFVQQAIVELRAQQAAARQGVTPGPARWRAMVLAALLAFVISILAARFIAGIRSMPATKLPPPPAATIRTDALRPPNPPTPPAPGRLPARP